LNQHILYKLSEIVEFCESYSSAEAFEIKNLTLKEALALQAEKIKEARNNAIQESN
jgi:hypothetical protein